MRAVIQRVDEASVSIGGEAVSRIGPGLLVLVGVEEGDAAADAEWLAAKIVQLRVFSDAAGKMNQSVHDVGGEVLVVSQFTLHAGTRHGNRPSFTRAAKPDVAIPLYEAFAAAVERSLERPVARGVFAADMQVSLVNDGPVTIIIDSRQRE